MTGIRAKETEMAFREEFDYVRTGTSRTECTFRPPGSTRTAENTLAVMAQREVKLLHVYFQ